MNNDPYNIVILSGKGGTGKTTVTAALCGLAQENIAVDCDVDAADLFLLLKPQAANSRAFQGSKKASIDPELCTQCGLCETLCRFDAIRNFKVNTFSCEGCGLCFRACPVNAIAFEDFISGAIYDTAAVNTHNFIYASLMPGEGNSGRLVTELKRIALEHYKEYTVPYIILDGPPGIGCPVNASITGADLAVIVTEPTQSGLHDLKRLVRLINNFKIETALIINKEGMNDNVSVEIENFIAQNGIPLLGKIPYDYQAVEALREAKTLLEIDSPLRESIINIWNSIVKMKASRE